MEIIKLNLARNCLKYICKAYGINKILLPYYTCPVVWNSLREESCEVKFYHIDKDFLPTEKFKKNDFILYTNYFGINSKNCKKLAKKYPNIIIDNSQGFFSEPLGLASFNSLRKFFNVQNGAYLFTSKQLEQVFEADKIELQPVSMQEDYEKFLKNELFLDSQKQIKTISPKVEKMMNDIDFEAESIKRVRIFKQYEKVLKNFNNIQLDLNIGDIPYCYPFSPNSEIIKRKLWSKNLVLLQLWKNFPKSFVESEFLNDTIALPLDNAEYAEKIIEIIN